MRSCTSLPLGVLTPDLGQDVLTRQLVVVFGACVLTDTGDEIGFRVGGDHVASGPAGHALCHVFFSCSCGCPSCCQQTPIALSPHSSLGETQEAEELRGWAMTAVDCLARGDGRSAVGSVKAAWIAAIRSGRDVRSVGGIIGNAHALRDRDSSIGQEMRTGGEVPMERA